MLSGEPLDVGRLVEPDHVYRARNVDDMGGRALEGEVEMVPRFWLQ